MAVRPARGTGFRGRLYCLHRWWCCCFFVYTYSQHWCSYLNSTSVKVSEVVSRLTCTATTCFDRTGQHTSLRKPAGADARGQEGVAQ